ncbi:Hnm1p [Sugiyamaella lignohabitans]|uniref:Hnm1p n=1 Tax=Sugiyamaella lignohabitans TaxID=796027 RepID=A0A167EU15_9ASCO|nr:Hnm1p [Sugiyamaella lignohabitans]ANB14454.1 Hnm1p [Sugiyamaella lignohabitans]
MVEEEKKRLSVESLRSGQQQKLDAFDLADMGHAQELPRQFSMWSMLALAFSVLGTWATFAQDLMSGLQNGGSIAILWGLALVTICNICVAVSLGELCSSMPTALGQAYWIHRLWNTPAGRFSSYICAWINTFGWWTLTASQIAFMTNFILGIKVMFDNDWAGASEGWVQFLVYVGITVVFTLTNVLACRKDNFLAWFNNVVGIQFTMLFVIFSLAMLIAVGVHHDKHFQTAGFVFGKWLNETGWPDGVVWFTGLLQAAYGLTAFDSVIHMVEEIPSPRVNAPRVIYLAVIMGAITGGIFMVVCLFCIQDLDSILNSPTGLPFMQLLTDTVGVQGGAALLSIFVFNGLGQGVSVATTASRLTWGFARDGGLPFSQYFAHVDTYWHVPARSLWAQGVIIAVVGVLYLFASTVLEAILSVSTIALTISYGMPIAALVLVGRDKLTPGPFHLGRYGMFCNIVSIIYCCVTTVFFFFPGGPDPAPADMNYAIAVFGVMMVIALAFWFIKGRRTYLLTDEALIEMLRARELENSANDATVVVVDGQAPEKN